MARSCIRAAYVLGYDGRDHALIPEGEVVFEAGTIRFVGQRSSIGFDEEFDCGRSLLLPGFIDLNALGDVDHTILGLGLSDSARSALTWSTAYLAAGPIDVLTLDETLTAARWALVQLIRNGVTTALPVTSLLARAWAESSDEFIGIAEIAADLGLRTYLGPSFRSAVHVMRGSDMTTLAEDLSRGEMGLREAVRFIEHMDGSHGGLIRGLLVPSTIETCSPALLRATAEAAHHLEVPVRLHCCQSTREVQLIHARDGCSSIEHLARVGLLSTRTLLPHAIELGGPGATSEAVQRDLDLLTNSGSTIVHCPLVMARHGRALRSFGRLLRQNVSLGLGTDTAPPDMIANLQIGLFFARLVDQLDPPVSPADYLRAATLGGAWALGRPDLGRLALGAQADMIAVDLSDPHHAPMHDPVHHLFLSASGRDVQHAWIAGRQVMRSRTIPGVELAELQASAQRVFAKIRAAYGQRDPQNRPVSELFPASFPTRMTAAMANDSEGGKQEEVKYEVL